MDKKATIYYNKNEFVNEFCCPYCGIDMLSTYIFNTEKIVLLPLREMSYCKDCNKIFWIERIYMSIKELDINNYIIKKRE